VSKGLTQRESTSLRNDSSRQGGMNSWTFSPLQVLGSIGFGSMTVQSSHAHR